MKVKVVAKEKGFYDGIVRNEGDEFAVKSAKAVGKWMKVVKVTKDTILPAVN